MTVLTFEVIISHLVVAVIGRMKGEGENSENGPLRFGQHFQPPTY